MAINRGLSAGLTSAVEAADVRWGLLFYADFESGAVRLWTGIGSITISGDEYIGVGSLIGFSGVNENIDLSATSSSVTLSGIPSDLVSLALAEDYQGRSATISLAFFDGNNAVNETLVPIFNGQIDVMSINDNGETSEITVQAETAIALFSVTNPRWMTQASQQALYPDDKGFSFVAALQNREIVWGG